MSAYKITEHKFDMLVVGAALLGLVTPADGRIELNGTDLVGRSVRQFLDAGIGFVPEDRQRDGLVQTMSDVPRRGASRREPTNSRIITAPPQRKTDSSSIVAVLGPRRRRGDTCVKESRREVGLSSRRASSAERRCIA